MTLIKSHPSNQMMAVLFGALPTTRYFISLDPVLNSYYSLGSAVTFLGDFELEADLVTTAVTDGLIIGDDHSSSYYFALDGSNFKMFIAGSNSSFAHGGAIFDGKLHKVKAKLTSTTLEVFLDGSSLGTSTVTPYTGANNFLIGNSNSLNFYFDGIIANVKLTDIATPANSLTFVLGNPTANTEVNNGVTLTYNNIPTSIREEFQLSSDETQWDNISPPTQQLPAVIEIA